MKSFVHTRDASESRPGAAQLAYSEIRRLIQHGDLPGGTVVGEEELASRIAVSRTPVREALRALLRDGLVIEGPRRQLLVARVDEIRRAEAEHLLSLAQGFALDTAMTSGLDLEAIDQLRLIIIRQRRSIRSGDVESLLDLEDEFYAHLAIAAGLALTTGVIRQASAIARLGRLHRPRVLAELAAVPDHHETLVDRLEYQRGGVECDPTRPAEGAHDER